MVILTVFVFIGLLLLLVLAHEWGHFIVAKKAGCNVEEFGFGFPPRLASFFWRGTRYSLNLLPIGGFVKIEGEDMDEVVAGPASFAAKSASWKIAILAAGVIMNFIVAAVLLGIQGVIGVPVLVTDENAATLENHLSYIVDVAPQSPAEQAGIKPLDRVAAINGEAQPTVSRIQEVIAAHQGSEVTLEVERQGQHLRLTVMPRENPPENEGALGVALAATGLQRIPWWQAPWHGIERSVQMLVEIVRQFGLIAARLWQTGTVGESLTGPIGIAVYTNEVTKLGASYVLEFGALISLNLALINILPIPALDGGRILFVVLQRLIGRTFPGKVERITHTVGFALLILLMLVITFRDVQRYL